MTQDTIAQIMELLETVHKTAMDMGAPGTIERVANVSIVNNSVGLIADMMHQEWDIEGNSAEDEEFDGMDVRDFENKRRTIYRDKKYPENQVVYFVQEVSVDGFIKIGYSSRFEVRLNSIQVNNARELRTLLLLSGDRNTEREIQDQFFTARIRGDWFNPTPELLNFIEEHISLDRK